MFHPMKIRAKALLIFLSVSLIPLVAIGVLAYKRAEAAMKLSLGEGFRQVAHEAIDKVDRGLCEVYQNVRSWTQLELFQEILTGDVDGKLSSFLIGLNREYSYFANLTAINRKGEVVASSRPELIGTDFSKEACYQAIGGKAYLGDVQLHRVSQAWVVTFAFPISAKFEDSLAIGALCAYWKAEELFAMTQSSGNAGSQLASDRVLGHLSILTQDGLLISAPKSERSHFFTHEGLEIDWHALGLSGPTRRGYLIEQNQRTASPMLIGYEASTGYREFPGLGWIALVTQDVKTVFAPVERLKLMIVGTGFAVAMGAIFISLFLVQQMTRPIVEIGKVAQEVARGDFQHRINYLSGDELGALAKTFNQMVDDIKRQREELLVEKNFVDNVIRSMINTLVVADPAGNIKMVNRATCELLRYQEEELIGHPATKIFADEPSPHGQDQETSAQPPEIVSNVERTYLSKTGQRIPVLFSSSVLRGGDGAIEGVVYVAQDITERKDAEEKIREHVLELARSNQELGQFAYVASHDLQEPLRVIASYAQLVAKRYSNRIDSDANEFIEFMVQGVKRMQLLINDLLAYSRVGTRGKAFEPTNCQLLLDLTCANLQASIQESGATITYHDLPTVSADAPQLGQLFQNLIANAIKFRRKDAPPHIGVRAVRRQDEWLFAVRDNGIGIESRYGERIFIIFQRLHAREEYPGTGIGLAICKKVVERHGGRIWVESQPGAGSTFFFTLPAHK